MTEARGSEAVEGCGNGKIVLLGEHAVVYGMPAIAAGISLGAVARAAPSQESSIRIADRRARASDGSELSAALAATCQALGAGPRQVEVDVTLPLGSGLGGSAAIGVAVARALLKTLGETETRERVLHGAAAWEQVFHGNPSGVDAAAAYAGGCIWFTKEGGPEPLFVAVPLQLAVCLAGPPASTKQMVESVQRLGDRRPDLLGKSLAGIESLVKNARLCIEAGDVTGLGQLMNYNQMLLSGLFLSTNEIERACAVAREAGALGAKLTGAGGGGAVIALCDGSPTPVETALRDAGFTAFSTEIAASSVLGARP
jgi:mevalonate kinase